METEGSKPSNTSCDSKKTKKKRKKKKKRKDTTSDYCTTSESTVKDRSGRAPLPPILPPTARGRRCVPPLAPQLPDKKDAEQQAPGSAARSRRRRNDGKSPACRLSRSSSSGGGGGVSSVQQQGQESLRWEGALEDPQAEERRLELYKADRRQRYVAHRESVQKENQEKPKQREKRP